VLDVSPVILLTKLPVPVPPGTVLSVVVGFAEILQHMPLWVTVAPPSLVTLPPVAAVVAVIPDAAVVVTTGITALAANEISFP